MFRYNMGRGKGFGLKGLRVYGFKGLGFGACTRRVRLRVSGLGVRHIEATK